MKTVLHYVRINYGVMIFLIAALTMTVAVTYAMFNTFGWYALIFFAISGYTSYALSTGFTNFTLN